jgi:trans-aconitate methyltransferase
MKPGLQNHLHEHTYPAFLMRRPRLIGFIHAWNLLVLQRNQITCRTLMKLLPTLPADSLIVDAGCGDGQHIFPYHRKFPRLRFWGIDKNDGHIAFCEKYCETMPPDSKPKFISQNLEDLQLENEADVLLSIGILQYIEQDRIVLENFYKTLKTNGNLILYTPVNGRMILPIYRRFFKKLNHYEKSQERRRIYSPSEILEKIKTAGFEIREQHFTYGTPGIIGHEIYSLLLMGIGNAGNGAWVFAPLLLILLPLILLLNQVDRLIPKKNGNGLLLLAQKPTLNAPVFNEIES